MVELIENEIMEKQLNINWNDIAGLEFAKKTIQEIIIWPMLRPDIFRGLRAPPRVMNVYLYENYRVFYSLVLQELEKHY